MSGGYLIPDESVFGQFLRLAFLRSPNYAAGVSGWTVNQDGSAEFNNLTLRGTFFGTDFIINSSGAFFYSGTPAANNLILSDTNGSGTDSFGNAFLAGTTSYELLSGNWYASQLNAGQLAWYSGGVTEAGPWVQTSSISGVGSPDLTLASNRNIILQQPVQATGGSVANPTVITTDGWHTLALGAEWTGSLSYRLTTENTVRVSCAAIFTDNGLTHLASGAVIGTVPAAYTPVANKNAPAYVSGSGLAIAANRVPGIGVNTSGQVTAQQVTTSAVGNAVTFWASFEYALDV